MPDDEDVNGLFEVAPESAGTRRPVVKGPVDKTFRAFDPDLLLPPSLDEWLPGDHMARFIADVVDEHLDLSRIHAAYDEGRGAPPYDPRLMVRILLHGYTTGIRSSRKLEAACVDVVAFRWLAAGTAPDYRSIARFRKRHLSALGHLFVQALALCQAAGMVKLGRVALDGTKVRANASRRKAMSYARMSEKEKLLAEEVSQLLAEAEALDAAEDAQFGKDRRGDELPEELRRRESRLAAIRAAKQALENEARERAEAAAEAKARARGADDDTVAEKVAAAGANATPKPKAQRNFTDPESRIMKTSDGSFHQCFNAQAVVDAEHKVIVATDLDTCAADGGNLEAVAEVSDETGTEFFIATGRTKHDDPIPEPPRGRNPNDATPRQRMTRKLKTKRGRAAYARRKVIVEPVFGQMGTVQNSKHHTPAGTRPSQGEWLLLAACHNLRKLQGHIGLNGLRDLATT